MIEILLSAEQRAALGTIVAQSAGLEATLDILICSLTGLSEAQFRILVGGQMIGRKLELAKDLALLKLKSKAKISRLTDLFSRLVSLNSKRNTVVHGTWGTKEGGARLSWLFSAQQPPAEDIHAVLKKRGAKLQTVSSTKLDEIATKLSEANSELFSFLMDEFIQPKVHRSVGRTKIKAA
jgi:hypothetical protein